MVTLYSGAVNFNGTVAGKTVVCVGGRIFMDILKRRHNLKSGTRRIKPLRRPVQQNTRFIILKQLLPDQ